MRFLFLFLIATSTTFADKWLALSTGCSGIVRPKDQNPIYQIEYQPNPLVKPCNWFYLRPQLGFFVNNRLSFYLYGGFRLEFMPTTWLIITPGIAPGIYVKGQGKNLHYPIEYKSSFEIAFQYKNNTRRVGAQFYHISNASIGYRNPGTENLMITYSIKI